MKITFLTLVLIATTSAFAKEDVKQFNKVLLEDVQKDVKAENDFALKKAPMRGPASVEAVEPIAEENSKLEKKERQFGTSKW